MYMNLKLPTVNSLDYFQLPSVVPKGKEGQNGHGDTERNKHSSFATVRNINDQN